MKYIKLFESFDRYDFGIIDDSNQVTMYAKYDEIESNYEDFKDEDFEIIEKNISGGNRVIRKGGIKIDNTYRRQYVHISLNPGIYYKIFNLGDFCFAIVYGNSEPREVQIVDQIEEVICVLKKKLKI